MISVSAKIDYQEVRENFWGKRRLKKMVSLQKCSSADHSCLWYKAKLLSGFLPGFFHGERTKSIVMLIFLLFSDKILGKAKTFEGVGRGGGQTASGTPRWKKVRTLSWFCPELGRMLPLLSKRVQTWKRNYNRPWNCKFQIVKPPSGPLKGLPNFWGISKWTAKRAA